jgi:hypothetical protein
MKYMSVFEARLEIRDLTIECLSMTSSLNLYSVN